MATPAHEFSSLTHFRNHVEIAPGDLVLYRFWCDDEWLSDGQPHLVVRIESGMAEVLMLSEMRRVPVILLKKTTEDLPFFARII